MEEIEKYRFIYANPDRYARYGHTNHGKKVDEKFLRPHRTLLDVGCGYNEFVINARKLGIEATGVDFACPGADIIAPADRLPFPAKSHDLLTSFDMLEHLTPDQVRPVLKEFARVSNHFIFSISYVPSVNKVQGEGLHPTVRSKEWWIARIQEAGGEVHSEGNYLMGRWGAPLLPPVLEGESVILIGNGPAVLNGGLGKRIDEFDQVVRFNRFHILGHEESVGTKTTLWSTFGRGTLPGEEGQQPKRVICIHEQGVPATEGIEELWRIPLSFFNRIRKRVQDVSEREGERHAGTIPSSGLLVSSWLSEVHEVPVLFLHGFDHFHKTAHEHSKRHHYWNEKTYGQPTEHDGEAEAKVFAEMRAACRVKYLT